MLRLPAHRNSTLWTRSVLLLLALCIYGSIKISFAQEGVPYTQDEIDKKRLPSFKGLATKEMEDTDLNEIRDMLEGQPMVKAKFDSYFQQVIFPHFTQLSNTVVFPKGVAKGKAAPVVSGPTSDLPRLRGEFRRYFYNRADIDPANEAAAAAAREQLNSITANRMYQIALNQNVKGEAVNYHPLARFHATLFLTELQVESLPDTVRNPPPFPMAIEFLQRLSVAAPNTVTEAIRVTALRAVLNYVTNQKALDAKTIADAAKYAYIADAWLSTKSPLAASVGPDAVSVIRRRVIDLSTDLYNKSPDPNKPLLEKLPDLLNGLVADETSAPEVRLAALKALSNLPKLPASIKPEQLYKQAGALSIAAVQYQLQEIVSLPVPPYTAKFLKGQLEVIDSSLKQIADKSKSTFPWQDQLTALIVACDTKWDQVTPTDPDALSKAIRKAGATMDIAITGKDKSVLDFDFVKIPKGFSGVNSGAPGMGGMPSGGGISRPGFGGGAASREGGR